MLTITLSCYLLASAASVMAGDYACECWMDTDDAIICECEEPPADYGDWPDDMHVHDGCRVWHRGAACTLYGHVQSRKVKSKNKRRRPMRPTAPALFTAAGRQGGRCPPALI